MPLTASRPIPVSDPSSSLLTWQQVAAVPGRYVVASDPNSPIYIVYAPSTSTNRNVVVAAAGILRPVRFWSIGTSAIYRRIPDTEKLTIVV